MNFYRLISGSGGTITFEGDGTMCVCCVRSVRFELETLRLHVQCKHIQDKHKDVLCILFGHPLPIS